MAAKSAACWPVRNSLAIPVLPAQKPLTRPARNPTATSTEVRFISPPLCPHMSPPGLFVNAPQALCTQARGKSHCPTSLICMLTDAPYLRPKFRGAIFGHATIGVKLCDRGGILGNGVGFREAVRDFNSSDRPG